MPHLTSYSFSLQIYGVACLQSLVNSPTPGGLHLARQPAGTGVGVVLCLFQPDSVFVDVDPSPLIALIAGPKTECDQVDPVTGGRELS